MSGPLAGLRMIDLSGDIEALTARGTVRLPAEVP